MILLKDGWNTFAEDYDGVTLTVDKKGEFNTPTPPIFAFHKLKEGEPRKRISGARVIPENIKKEIGFILLKDGWRYRDGSKYIRIKKENPLGIRGRDRFNNPGTPVFHINPKEGGATEIAEENVKIKLGIDFPSELIYGNFSTIVGWRAIVQTPLHFNQAYVHIPSDWTTRTNQLILVYSLLWNLQVEKKNNYTKGKISL